MGAAVGAAVTAGGNVGAGVTTGAVVGATVAVAGGVAAREGGAPVTGPGTTELVGVGAVVVPVPVAVVGTVVGTLDVGSLSPVVPVPPVRSVGAAAVGLR